MLLNESKSKRSDTHQFSWEYSTNVTEFTVNEEHIDLVEEENTDIVNVTR